MAYYSYAQKILRTTMTSAKQKVQRRKTTRFSQKTTIIHFWNIRDTTTKERKDSYDYYHPMSLGESISNAVKDLVQD